MEQQKTKRKTQKQAYCEMNVRCMRGSRSRRICKSILSQDENIKFAEEENMISKRLMSINIREGKDDQEYKIIVEYGM